MVPLLVLDMVPVTVIDGPVDEVTTVGVMPVIVVRR